MTVKCCVCGAESGRYPLCRACNEKKEHGEIIKCTKCGQWHYKYAVCPIKIEPEFRYECRKSLITENEQLYFKALRERVPQGYHVFPQVNLAAIVEKMENSPFRNELFRNVDFLITDAQFAPKIIVEINDPSHHQYDRRKRDEKVVAICAEAGMPIITLWTNYGVNPDYIEKRILDALHNPPQRMKMTSEESAGQDEHFSHTAEQKSWDKMAEQHNETHGRKQGCYVATCVYGSYDCPQVWTLRRYRDRVLKKSVFGRCFIKLYYAVSPLLVRCFGGNNLVRAMWRSVLNPIVNRLNGKGFADTPYFDA